MIAYLSRGQMKDQVAALIGDTSSSRATKIANALNMAYHDFATHFRWPQLLRTSEQQVTVTSGASYLYLPEEIEKVFFVLPNNLNKVWESRNIEALFNTYAEQSTTSGQTVHFADAGEIARRYDFRSGGEQLEIAQTGLTATTTAFVRGAITASPGNATEESYEEIATVSATAGVYTALSSGLTYTDLHSFSVQSNDSGRYFLRGVTSQTIYASFGPGEICSRYRRLRLFNPPADSPTIIMGWKKRVSLLNNDAQSIELPIGYALVNKAVALMRTEQREMQAAAYHDALANQEVESAFTASSTQGESIEQGAPFGRYRGGWRSGITVVNP